MKSLGVSLFCWEGVFWGCGRGLKRPGEECKLAAIMLTRLLNKIQRAELPLPSPPRVSCAATDSVDVSREDLVPQGGGNRQLGNFGFKAIAFA